MIHSIVVQNTQYMFVIVSCNLKMQYYLLLFKTLNDSKPLLLIIGGTSINQIA